jgi:WD40 repeat protein
MLKISIPVILTLSMKLFWLLLRWIKQSQFGVLFYFEFLMVDIRNTSKKLRSLEGHKEEVMKVEWSKFNLGVLASCSNDRRLIVWDLTKENNEIQNALVIKLISSFMQDIKAKSTISVGTGMIN